MDELRQRLRPHVSPRILYPSGNQFTNSPDENNASRNIDATIEIINKYTNIDDYMKNENTYESLSAYPIPPIRIERIVEDYYNQLQPRTEIPSMPEKPEGSEGGKRRKKSRRRNKSKKQRSKRRCR